MKLDSLSAVITMETAGDYRSMGPATATGSAVNVETVALTSNTSAPVSVTVQYHLKYHLCFFPLFMLDHQTAGLCKESCLYSSNYSMILLCSLLSDNTRIMYFLFLSVTDDYLIVAVGSEVYHMSLNGTDVQTLVSDVNERKFGIDYHLR